MGEPRTREWIEALRASEGLPRGYATAVTGVIGPLAENIEALTRASGRPVIVGINGAQGAGKSTMARFLAEWLRREHAVRCTVLALDDLYLGKQARAALGRRQHPLLATRGVPGTHDVALGCQLLHALTRSEGRGCVALPVFDKATDDRLTRDRWRVVEAQVEVVLFEGWCVGATPQAPPALLEPVNTLEATEDPDGSWRRWVNEQLAADYATLFRLLDALIMLRVPSFESVYRWRALQERKLPQRRREDGAAGCRDRLQLTRFIMHFERLTRHMLGTLPAAADTVIDIDSSHRMAGMRDRGWDARLAARLQALTRDH